MEVGVRIEAQDPSTGKTTHTGSCHLTFVALDESGRPTPIAKVIPTTQEEKKRFSEALRRRRARQQELTEAEGH